MPFGNRKTYFRESFQFSIVTIKKKKISPLCKPEILLFKHFPKLKIAYFNGEKSFISLELNFTSISLGCYGLSRHSLKRGISERLGVQQGLWRHDS